MNIKNIFALILIVITVGSCKKTPTVDQAKVDDGIIKNYISSNGLNATATGSGLYYVIKTVGTGANPTANSTVNVVYKGYYTNGSVFDQSSVSGASLNLGSVIAGWQEGIPYFRNVKISTDGNQNQNGLEARVSRLIDANVDFSKPHNFNSRAK